MNQWFVPWGVEPQNLADAIRALPAEVAARTAPRLSAVDADVIGVFRAAFPSVFVDLEAHDPLPLSGTVPVYGLDAAALECCARSAPATTEVAVRVPLTRFSDRARLTEELHAFGRATGTSPGQTTVFVDVPCADHAPAVILAASFGAVRRIRSLAPWRRIVLSLDGRAQQETRRSAAGRPPIGALAWSVELANVSFGERSPYGRGAAYPTASRWLGPANSAVLTELVTNHRDFVPTCCAGDAWFAAAPGAGGCDVPSDRAAAVVHWIVSTYRLLDEGSPEGSAHDPSRSENSDWVGSSP